MTRWKREATATILLMHAHNEWSMWNAALMDAADQLGLLVGRRSHPNGSGDGSFDDEFYVPTEQYVRLGGWPALRERATALHEQAMA